MTPLNVIALQREPEEGKKKIEPPHERYVFLYDTSAESYDLLLEKLEKFVDDPELSLTKKEADILREKAWELWWKDAQDDARNRVKKALDNGQ